MLRRPQKKSRENSATGGILVNVALALLIGVVFVILVLDIFAISYRWIRNRLGEVEPDAIPAARVSFSAKHQGFRQEPAWLRPLQATVLATGLTLTLVCALTFVLVAVGAAFV